LLGWCDQQLLESQRVDGGAQTVKVKKRKGEEEKRRSAKLWRTVKPSGKRGSRHVS
jgi:hypothetical protein